MYFCILGVLFSIKLVESSKSFQSINATLEPNNLVPGCKNLDFRSREYWECFVRCQNVPVFHLFGTCRMGKVGDSNSVVDSNLRLVNCL